MFEPVEWLFEGAPSGWFAQMGLARRDKRALVWVPGKKPQTEERVARLAARASLTGCTQLAFRAPFASLIDPENFESLICWVGLDIDGDDNPLPIAELLERIRCACPGASLRLSSSGRGVHVLYRLAAPIRCPPNQANILIRYLTQFAGAALDLIGVRVCKRDRRMFWLSGGQNAWVYRTEKLLASKLPELLFAPATMVSPPTLSGNFSPEIILWAERFQAAGILQDVKPHNLVYVGDVVKLLKTLGIRVKTRSPCSGNGHINGYIDIGWDTISLWSYADGYKIWSHTDVESVCEIFSEGAEHAHKLCP